MCRKRPVQCRATAVTGLPTDEAEVNSGIQSFCAVLVLLGSTSPRFIWLLHHGLSHPLPTPDHSNGLDVVKPFDSFSTFASVANRCYLKILLTWQGCWWRMMPTFCP